MVYSQKYCLVQLLEPMNIGEEFSASEWPLHCTIAGVFFLEWTDTASQQFREMIAGHKHFESVTTGTALFGPDKDIEVRLLENTADLYRLHSDVVDFIERHSGVFNEPLFLREDFTPHITMHDSSVLKDQLVPFYELALIDMFPGGDHTQRRVMELFQLTSRRP